MDGYIFFYERDAISQNDALPQKSTHFPAKETNIQITQQNINKNNSSKIHTVHSTSNESLDISKDTYEKINHHSHTVSNQCLYCDNFFSNTFELKKHLLSHEHESYQCKECNEVFKYITDFNVHMVIHKTDSARTMHGIMQEDIDGEISSSYNAVLSQQYTENIPPDPSEEAFLREFDDEESVGMNVQDEIVNQATPHQQLPVNEQDALQTTEMIQPRRSSRIAAIPHQQPREITKRTSKHLTNIARSCDVQFFNENDIITKVQPHNAGSLYDEYCKHCKAFRWKEESQTICCKKVT